jgi:hypothetical protein
MLHAGRSERAADVQSGDPERRGLINLENLENMVHFEAGRW